VDLPVQDFRQVPGLPVLVGVGVKQMDRYGLKIFAWMIPSVAAFLCATFLLFADTDRYGLAVICLDVIGGICAYRMVRVSEDEDPEREK